MYTAGEANQRRTRGSEPRAIHDEFRLATVVHIGPVACYTERPERHSRDVFVLPGIFWAAVLADIAEFATAQVRNEIPRPCAADGAGFVYVAKACWVRENLYHLVR